MLCDRLRYRCCCRGVIWLSAACNHEPHQRMPLVCFVTQYYLILLGVMTSLDCISSVPIETSLLSFVAEYGNNEQGMCIFGNHSLVPQRRQTSGVARLWSSTVAHLPAPSRKPPPRGAGGWGGDGVLQWHWLSNAYHTAPSCPPSIS